MGAGHVTDRPVTERPNGDAVDQDDASAPARSEREIANQLRLRPELPGVTRLSRKVLIGLGAVASIGIGGALVLALQGPQDDERPAELYNTDRVAQADGLGTLPRDYSGVPQLGPPLPGDLGRPMLSAQQRGQPVPAPPLPGAPGTPPPTQVDLAIQRAEQEREAARTSQLFNATETGAASVPALAAPVLGPTPALPAPVSAPSQPAARGEAFLARDVDRQTLSRERLRAPLSPYVLQAGSIIPAALLTALRSDLPGQMTAQVTGPVYDSPTGRLLLIPQGSRLIGQYDAEVGYGQERVLLVWNRLILPDGRSVVLERQPGADAQGYVGLQDRVENHWGRLIRAGLISTLLGVGAKLGSNNDSDIARAIRDGVQESVGDAGQEIVRRQLEIRPTLTIRAGYPVRVIVTRDLILSPQGVGQ